VKKTLKRPCISLFCFNDDTVEAKLSIFRGGDNDELDFLPEPLLELS
jgi:hypothetical protein